MIHALMCVMLPRNPGDEPEVRMHGKTFTDLGDAEDEHRTLRHQNLPMKVFHVAFEDPR